MRMVSLDELGTAASDIEAIADLSAELGVDPKADASDVIFGLRLPDGRVLSIAELLLAHVRLVKSLRDLQPGASER